MKAKYFTLILSFILKKIKFKSKLYEKLEKPQRNKNIFTGLKTNKKLFFEKTFALGYPIYTLYKNYKKDIKKDNKKNNNNQTNSLAKKHIIFFHGGGYIFDAVVGHKSLVLNLINSIDVKISFFDYPLAPENTYTKTFEMLKEGYFKLCEKYPGDEFILMGDSAGGGLALAFLQILVQAKHTKNIFINNLVNNLGNKYDNIPIKIPQKTILLSPWLDLSLSNPEIKNYEEKDPFLSYEILKKSAMLYAGIKEYDKKILQNPLLSPLFGSFNNLGKILVFTGTNEILYPDCLLLEQKAKTVQDISVKLIIEEDFVHDWLVFPFPGKAKAYKQIKEFILED